MVVKEKPRGRGRPRAFDEDAALAAAQSLFHQHGYDGVGVAALSQAMGISPPSLYAAFGDKAALFDRVLARYADTGLTIDDRMASGATPAAILSDLLRTAAQLYAADPRAPGCLVLEGARGGDAVAAGLACAWKAASARRFRDILMPTHPAEAERVADYMVTIMSGLSSDARAGQPVDRLVAVADMAGLAIVAVLGEA